MTLSGGPDLPSAERLPQLTIFRLRNDTTQGRYKIAEEYGGEPALGRRKWP
jgi:hypothetical protein